MNYFTSIINQIKNNVRARYSNNMFDEDTSSFEIKCKNYPTGILQYFCKRQGAFKIDVDNIKITHTNDQYGNNIYTITYKDLNLNAPCLKHIKQYDKTENRLELNNEFRFEDSKAYSTNAVTDEDMFSDQFKYEKLEKADDCCFELFLQTRGFENIEDFNKFCDIYKLPNDFLDDLYKQFLETGIANPWEYADEQDLELVTA